MPRRAERAAAPRLEQVVDGEAPKVVVVVGRVDRAVRELQRDVGAEVDRGDAARRREDVVEGVLVGRRPVRRQRRERRRGDRARVEVG